MTGERSTPLCRPDVMKMNSLEFTVVLHAVLLDCVVLCCVWACLASVDFVWCRRLVANFVTLWDIGNSAHSRLSRSAANVPLASPSVRRVVRAKPRGIRIPFIHTANSSLQPPPSSTVMCSPVADLRTVHRPWTCDCALVFSRTRL